MNTLKNILSKITKIGFAKTFSLLVERIKLKKILKADSLEERFDMIYKENHWSSDESISGVGSEIAYTHNLRTWLIQKIGELDIKKLVDAPCGDFNWMQLVTKKVDVDYIGIDIVEEIINSNNSLYRNDNTEFHLGNICTDVLPACELLIVRDCLFHLSFNDINKFLNNISKLEYKYLLTTNHEFDSNYVNLDIASGDFRYIDLYNEPFNFGKSDIIDRVDDFPENHADFPENYSTNAREMILIEKQNVPTSISNL
tara:strand:+ start:4224 stop:4991 length:768 start_codon:yes stop_codon:yes gene_type:complete